MVLVLIYPTCCIFRHLPTLPSLVSRQLSCCCIHTTSVLCAKSEPIINGYLAFLNLADPLQLLVPDFVTSLYTLPTCVICEQLFRWDKHLFALHVITYYSMPLATAFTCSILLCCHKDLLYGCLSLSSIPSILPAVKRANVYYALPLLVLTLGVVRFVELLPASCIYKQ